MEHHKLLYIASNILIWTGSVDSMDRTQYVITPATVTERSRYEYAKTNEWSFVCQTRITIIMISISISIIIIIWAVTN